MFNDEETFFCGTQGLEDDPADGAYAARQALLNHLRREWPNSVDLAARQIAPGVCNADFLRACMALQDDGLIMYEALLINVGPSPKLLAAVLTFKGQRAAPQEHL